MDCGETPENDFNNYILVLIYIITFLICYLGIWIIM